MNGPEPEPTRYECVARGCPLYGVTTSSPHAHARTRYGRIKPVRMVLHLPPPPTPPVTRWRP